MRKPAQLESARRDTTAVAEASRLLPPARPPSPALQDAHGRRHDRGRPDPRQGQLRELAAQDLVIWKTTDGPTYNFACVIDDHLMEMSHVIRGDEHLSNTPSQIQMYKALGWSRRSSPTCR